MPTTTKLSYSAIRRASLSHVTWVFLLSFLFQLFAEMDSTIFGLNKHEPFMSALSFCPALPWRSEGLSLLTYPLVHVSWIHWGSSSFFWLMLSPRILKAINKSGWKGNLVAFFLYGLLCALIALSFLMPWAPSSSEQDRVLGLSAVILFQISFLLILKPNIFIFPLAAALTYLYFSEGSALANWGHAMGFLLGSFFAVIQKFTSRSPLTSHTPHEERP